MPSLLTEPGTSRGRLSMHLAVAALLVCWTSACGDGDSTPEPSIPSDGSGASTNNPLPTAVGSDSADGDVADGDTDGDTGDGDTGDGDTGDGDTGDADDSQPAVPTDPCPTQVTCPSDTFPSVDEHGCAICRPPSDEGGPCAEHAHCAVDLFCQEDECVPLTELGCDLQGDCFGGICAIDRCAPPCTPEGDGTWACEDGRACHRTMGGTLPVEACVTEEQCEALSDVCGERLRAPGEPPGLGCHAGSSERIPGWMSPMEGPCGFPAPAPSPCTYFGRMVDVVVVEVTSVGEHRESPPANAECEPDEHPHLLVEGEVRASLLDQLDGTISFRFPARATMHSQYASEGPMNHSGWDPRLEWDEDHGLIWTRYRRTADEAGPLCAGVHILVALAPSRDGSLTDVLTADPSIGLAEPEDDDWKITWPPGIACLSTIFPLLSTGSTVSEYRADAAGCEEDPNDAELRWPLCP